MDQGLFDIAVNVGTSDPFNPDSGNGVVHTGTTGGPASSGAGDNHRIYMVAVPKNQALTMLLTGNAGFTPASTATLDNGTIVLAAGSNVAETSEAWSSPRRRGSTPTLRSGRAPTVGRARPARGRHFGGCRQRLHDLFARPLADEPAGG